MSWITIDSELCTGCGTCLTICGRGCFTMMEGAVKAQADDASCSLCGHCVAICPADAISHNQMKMKEIIELENDGISSEQFIKLLQKRRSHRHFQDHEVPSKVLTKLLGICRYAPTGSNAQSVEIVAIVDRTKIHRLSELTIDYFQQAMQHVEEEVAGLVAAGKAIPRELSRIQRKFPMFRRHIASWKAGRDPILHNAPVVLIFHSTTDSSTPKDDCVIAAHTVTLTAMTMGLETCYIGLLEKAASSPLIQEAINLPSGNKVYSVLITGYPKYQFLRTAYRKPIPITWM